MQKNKFIATLLILIIVMSCNQKAESQNPKKGYAPEAVKITFQNKYPEENDPDWHIDSNGNYESRFRINGVRHRADFSPDGKWIETEVSIKKKELPKAIRDALKKDFDHEKITEIERVESAEKGLFFDVEFKRKGKNKDVEFNTKGEILN